MTLTFILIAFTSGQTHPSGIITVAALPSPEMRLIPWRHVRLPIFFRILSFLSSPTWSRHSLILLPTPTDRGQGLNNALEDAARYVSTLSDVFAGKQALSDAIAAYDEEMRPRGAAEIATTQKQAFAMHHWDAMMDSPIAKHGFQKVSGANL